MKHTNDTQTHQTRTELSVPAVASSGKAVANDDATIAPSWKPKSSTKLSVDLLSTSESHEHVYKRLDNHIITLYASIYFLLIY